MEGEREIHIQSNGEIHQTHTCLSLDWSNIVLATEFIQILNESQDFDLWILLLHIFAILYGFWVSFRDFSAPSQVL